MTKIVISLFVIFLAGCSAVSITNEGLHVRQIQPNDATICSFLSVIEVSGGLFYSSQTEAKRDMLAKIRNQVAGINGNAYVITSIVVERGFSLPFAQADAYKCP